MRLTYARVTCVLAVALLAVGTPAGARVADSAKKLVTGKQVKDKSLTGKDFKNGSIGAAKFAKGTFKPGPAGANGAPGAPGDKGASGDAGAPGDQGAAGSGGSPGDKGETGKSAATDPSQFPPVP